MKKLMYSTILCCFAAVVCMPSYAFAGTEKHCCTKSIKKDAIVGAWLYNQSLEFTESQVYGVAEFHADGTYIVHDSGNLTQGLPPQATNGLYFTVATGKWKKVGKRQYKLVDTAVILNRGFDCTTGDPVDLANPACPFARTRNVSDFFLNSDHQTANVNSTTILYQVNDLTLTQDISPPLSFTRVFQKLR